MSLHITKMLSAIVLVVWCLGSVGAGQDFAGGTGQADDPYQIATADQLMALAQDPNLYDKHVVLTADIDLAVDEFSTRPRLRGILYEFDFIYDGTPFTGTFDGAGHHIANLTIDIGAPANGFDFLGLFGFLDDGAVVKNLVLTEVSIQGGINSDYLGGLAGRAYGVTVENCQVSGMVGSGLNAQYIGGLLGECRGATISRCFSTCTVTGDENSTCLGGLVGHLTAGSLTDCSAGATVQGNTQSNSIGGLMGLAVDVTAWRCQSGSVVSGGIASSAIGGLIGQGGGIVLTECSSTEAITGQSLSNQLGGLIGAVNGGTLTDCHSAASMEGASESFEIGGLIGYAHDVMLAGCHSSGPITGRINADYLGGLVGLFEGRSERMFAQAKIVECYSSSPVTGGDNSDHVGGLVGQNSSQGKIYRSYATGDVLAEEEVGGLVGWNSGSLVDCYATGQVGSVIDADRLGGLVGRNAGTICGCYATGAVIGDFNSDHLGGLAGKNEYVISDSYATGDVTGGQDAEDLGGFVGFNQDSRTLILRCYSTGAVTSQSTDTHIGAFVGYHRNGHIRDCYWNVDSAGMVKGIGVLGGSQDEDDVAGLTAAQMQNPESFVGWGFAGAVGTGLNNQWVLAGDPAPVLWWQRPETVPLPTFSGGSGTEDDPYLIADVTDLNSIGYNPRVLDKHYKLVADLDLSGGQVPRMIGNDLDPFTGTFDGDGHTIENVTTVERARYDDFIGLFGCMGPGSEVRSLSLAVRFQAEGYPFEATGALAGWASGATVADCHVTGSIAGRDYTGGLIGFAGQTDVSNSSVSAGVTGREYTGGLIGHNDQGHVTGCRTEGSVEGDRGCGGLIASMNAGSLTYSANAATVTSDWDYIGGLVGSCNLSEVSHSYSTGSATGNNYVGGAFGQAGASQISCCYSTGSADGDGFIGGFIGSIYGGKVLHCYSTGAVSAQTSWVGGFVGHFIWNAYTDPRAPGCFWDIETSGQTRGEEGQGLTTAEMQNIDTYLAAGWDFVDETDNGTDDTWFMPEAHYPHLTWEGRD